MNIVNILEYIKQNNLFDHKMLERHCESNQVYIIESERFPGLVMLHYKPKAHFDNLWTPFNRACRGLILDMRNKRVVAFPFEKFFNLDEMPETEYKELLRNGPFEVSEKLDGSMLILFKDPNTGKNVFTTKGSFDSEQALLANEKFMPDALAIEGNLIADQFDLMFEFITKEFRIVVDYQLKGYHEGSYLIGARQKDTGRLLTYSEVLSLGRLFKIPTMKIYHEFNSIEDLIKNKEQLSILDEGYVMLFETGLRVKVKGDKYLAAHKFISKLSPKYILEAMVGNCEKELINIAPEEYRSDVENCIKEFLKDKQEIIESATNFYNVAPKDTRKEFALWVIGRVPDDLRGPVFTLFDKKEVTMKNIAKIIMKRKHVSHDTKI